MLATASSDQSFRLLLQEWARRRDATLDEFRERIAGFLAIGLVAAVPVWWATPGSEVALVEPSEAAEPNAGPHAFAALLVNSDAVLNRLETDRLSAAEMRSVQTLLKDKGFNPGRIDGMAGKRTLAALNQYRRSIHLPPAKEVDREAVASLQAQ